MYNVHERGEHGNEAEEGVRGRGEDSSHHEVELAAEVKEQEQQSARDEKVEHGGGKESAKEWLKLMIEGAGVTTICLPVAIGLYLLFAPNVQPHKSFCAPAVTSGWQDI